MKRKVNQQKHPYKWKRKLCAALFLGLCFTSLVLMQTQYSQVMSLASLRSQYAPKPKLAFLFIARNRLPLDMVWDAFLQVCVFSNQNFSRNLNW